MKRYRPTSPGQRGTVLVSYRDALSTSKPNKKLTKGFKRSKGRNNAGRITTRHKGGGNKRLYRDIDTKMFDKAGIPARVETVEYDPNRSAFIGILVYKDGERRYTILPAGIKVGDKVLTQEDADPKLGNRLVLKNIPVGTFVCNIEFRPNGGGKIARGAGAYAQVSAHDAGQTFLKMPSGEVRKVSDLCWATIGEMSNPQHKLINKGKAGRNRWLGKRPTVRGSAMNPVDHPHGGGEGRQGIALRRGPKTRQGKLAYGVKTRRKNKYSNPNIVSRRKTKRG